MQGTPLRSRQSGFTLVEIAIVLVIIGLLLGGILKGQEMITQARIKNIINDFNGITAAYFSYQDRYKAVPGDDLAAATRWLPATFTGMISGDGNGAILGTYSAAPVSPLTTAFESLAFWFHLRAAGFVAGPTATQSAWTQPTNSVGGIVGVQSGAYGIAGLAICSANVPDKIAGAIDTQMDDQRPGAGQVQAGVQTAGQTNQPTALTTAPIATTTYVESGTTQLVVCKTI